MIECHSSPVLPPAVTLIHSRLLALRRSATLAHSTFFTSPSVLLRMLHVLCSLRSLRFSRHTSHLALHDARCALARCKLHVTYVPKVP